MLVINKLAVSANGLPTVVAGAQLAVSAAVVVVDGTRGRGRARTVREEADRAVRAVHDDVRDGVVLEHEGADADKRRGGDFGEVLPAAHRVRRSSGFS